MGEINCGDVKDNNYIGKSSMSNRKEIIMVVWIGWESSFDVGCTIAVPENLSTLKKYFVPLSLYTLITQHLFTHDTQ